MATHAGATRTISPRRRAWLDAEVAAWQADGVITAETAAALRNRYTVTTRVSVARVVLALGSAFVAVGVIWLVAANLDRISPAVRFGGVVALWLGLLVAAELLTGYGGPVLGAGRLLATAAYGAVVFQAAQSLQVPAYQPALLGWWAAGALLYAYVVAGTAPLVTGLAVAVVWLLTSSAQGASSALGPAVALLVGGVLATGVGALHEARWRPDFAPPWRIGAALLALIGLFLAALPVYRPDDGWDLTTATLVVAGAAVVAALGAVVLCGPAQRLEVVAVVALAGAGAGLTAWRPEGDLLDPTPSLTARAITSVAVYLLAASWYAVLGARREAAGLTWLATAAVVVFVTVQSVAVFAPVVTGATLFLVVGAVLLIAGFAVDRGRRRLLAEVEDRS